MITLQVTEEQAKAIAEALQIAAAIASRNDDYDTFTFFNMEDLMYAQVPQLVGTDYSAHFKRPYYEM